MAAVIRLVATLNDVSLLSKAVGETPLSRFGLFLREIDPLCHEFLVQIYAKPFDDSSCEAMALRAASAAEVFIKACFWSF